MPSLLASLALVLSLAPLRAQEESASQPDARVTRVEGSVYLSLKDHPEEGFIPAQLGAPLSEGDQVRTGINGRAELALDDESMIELGPNTDLLVTSLGEQREVYLGIGSLVAKLKKLVEGRRMRFRTPTAVAAVRGTELAVTQEGDEQAVVGVFDEGEVSVTSSEGKEEVVLGPHQETECRRGRPPAKVREMKRLIERRERLVQCRTRFEAMRREWKPRPMDERRQFRQRLQAVRVMREGQMKNIGRDQQRRDYREMRERFRQERGERQQQRRENRQERRDNRQERRENRQEHRENRQDRRQERHEGGRQHQGGNQPGGGDGRTWIRGPGQGQDQQRHGGFQGQPPGGGHQGGMGQGGGQGWQRAPGQQGQGQGGGQQGQRQRPQQGGRDRRP